MRSIKSATQIKLWLAFMSVLVLVPLILTPIPPLIDYPNHLTRLWLIAGGIDIPPLNQFYTLDWHGLATNIGIDLAAAAFGSVIPTQLLGRILLALAILLPPAGAILLHRRLFHVWHPWQILFLFFWCSETLLLGFINFQISLGLALFAAVLDTFLTHNSRIARLTIRMLCGLLLILVHPFGLLFYGALLAALRFGPILPTRKDFLPRAWHALKTSCVILIPVLCAALYSGKLPGFNGDDDFFLKWNTLTDKIAVLQSPFFAYDPLVDAGLEIFFILGVITILHGRKKDLHAGMLTASALVWLLALSMPHMLGQASWIDLRLPIMAVYLSLLMLCPREEAEQKSRAALALPIALTLLILRTGWIGWNWTASNAQIAATEKSLSALPEGARLLPVQNIHLSSGLTHPGRTMRFCETFRHYGALAVIWRHAFVPTLFAIPGQQPLRVRPPYDKIASMHGGGNLSPVQSLTDSARRASNTDFILRWRTKFDYVLLLNADLPATGKAEPLPAALHLIRDDGFSRLYKITPTHPIRSDQK